MPARSVNETWQSPKPLHPGETRTLGFVRVLRGIVDSGFEGGVQWRIKDLSPADEQPAPDCPADDAGIPGDKGVARIRA